MIPSQTVTPQVEGQDKLTPEQEAHNQAMLDKADKGLGSQVDTGEQLFAGKYKTKEDLGKAALELLSKREGGLEGAYKDLERDFHGNNTNTGEGEEKPEEKPEAGEGEDGEDEGDVDLSQFSKELATTGTFSEESQAALKEMGVPEGMLTQIMEGQKALDQLNDQAAYNLTGGEENYNSMLQWAKANLSASDIETYNDAMVGDVTARNQAVSNLFKQYAMANPTSLDGKGGQLNVETGDVYNSVAELTADINDPRYHKDPAFRNTVESKLKRSKIM